VKILVTGGAGFIGSTLVDRLVTEGHDVAIVDDLSSGTLDNLTFALDAGARLHQLDIRDERVSRVIADAHPDAVVHLAAQIDVRLSVADPVADAMANVIGTLRVLEGARQGGARKVLYATSGGAMYGSLGDGQPPATEQAPRHPESPYGVSKMVTLDYLALYRQLYGLDFTALALANVYGPRQDPFGEGGVVSIFGERLLEDLPCTVYGDGEQTRDFVFVGDVAEAFAAALTSGSGEVLNIGTGRETSVIELYRIMAAAAGSSRERVLAPARPGEARRSCLDATLASRVLGWTPRTSLPDGVRATLRHLAG
jgi:UDP-glucose 4-epimerase